MRRHSRVVTVALLAVLCVASLPAKAAIAPDQVRGFGRVCLTLATGRDDVRQLWFSSRVTILSVMIKNIQ